jgi:drug/metabolite transporter (DMT)-like permease
MSLAIFLAVLFAAFLHAGWNALIKFGGSRLTGMLILTMSQAAIALPVVLTNPLPARAVWPWLLASGAFHSAYKLFLSYAYQHGDLSRVYPIARGAAPLIVFVVTLAFLPDVLTWAEGGAILLLGVGILTMARGVVSDSENLRLVPFALGSAAATAGYSIVDGMGARVSGDALFYVAWLFVFDVMIFTPICLMLRGRSVLVATNRDWLLGALAGAASYGAYAIAVWAMTKAPIALVAALRETSILFAVFFGWLFFSEKINRTKLAAAGMVLAGLVLSRV